MHGFFETRLAIWFTNDFFNKLIVVLVIALNGKNSIQDGGVAFNVRKYTGKSGL